MTKEKLIIFDTTMRDGEQSPGASMTKEDKLRIARQLERMRVDIIEAGFPAASEGDFPVALNFKLLASNFLITVIPSVSTTHGFRLTFF